MQLEVDICNKLGLNPDLQLKKAIRGLKGYSTKELVLALITNQSVREAANSLGYTYSPVKQSIREILKPVLLNADERKWKNVLLDVVQYKLCGKCGRLLPNNAFHSNSSKTDGYSSNCGNCRVADAKLHKFYIKERTPIWSDLSLIQRFYENCPEGYEVDHEIPLKGKLVSGLHVISNLRYITPEENRTKLNKFEVF